MYVYTLLMYYFYDTDQTIQVLYDWRILANSILYK